MSVRAQTVSKPDRARLAGAQSGLLQRKCACGQHTVAGGECAECGKERNSLQRKADSQLAQGPGSSLSRVPFMQPKLIIGASDNPLEQEADRIADRVLAAPTQPAVTSAPPRIQRVAEQSAEHSVAAPDSVDRVLASPGKPLDPALRQEMERSFGRDFSRVRVHSGGAAEQSAREVSARAYTVGHNIVFGAGQFAPRTHEGRRLIAHELTHVVQQSTHLTRKLVQRCPDHTKDPEYDGKAAAIKGLAEYAKLPTVYSDQQPGTRSTADWIITEARTRTYCIYYIDELTRLFGKPVKPPATVSAETSASTAKALAAETKRVGAANLGRRVGEAPKPVSPAAARPKEANRTGLEEAASAGRVLQRIAGKFGGGHYFIDASDPNNIIVKAKILLTKKGRGTEKDVESIIAMEDAIEKAASTRGYLVDIEFVKVADENTFKADVNPGVWETAGNWSGGDPQGFAHELHHMFAFTLDRYDYIQRQAGNTSMEISNRLYWFSQELKKPAGYNDPKSILADPRQHPTDVDVCTVAGVADVAKCISSRETVNKAFNQITTANKTPEDRIRNSILKFQKSDPATMMAVLREVFRMLFGFPEAENIRKRLVSKNDALGKVFQQLTGDQQRELLKIIATPQK